jgi:superfamily II DNA/RNA helicase
MAAVLLASGVSSRGLDIVGLPHILTFVVP